MFKYRSFDLFAVALSFLFLHKAKEWLVRTEQEGSVFTEGVPVVVNNDLLICRYFRPNMEDVFSLPPLEQLLGFSVVITTCASSAMLAAHGVPRDHFTHVLIDESAQALEPEVGPNFYFSSVDSADGRC